MSIERIELRKKYYDGNMVRDAVMSVTDDYNTIMKLLSAFADQPPLTDVIEVVRCKDCIHRTKREMHYKNPPPHTMCIFREDDFYCADGVRREDDSN